MSAVLTIAQTTAVQYAYKSLKFTLDNYPEVDKEDIEESMEALEEAFPTLNLETVE